jgi:hypothetical protein
MADRDDRSRATNDAYTGMLIISLLALIGGSVLLYLDYSQYPTKLPDPVPSKSVQVPPPPVIEAKPPEPPPMPPMGMPPMGMPPMPMP